MKKIFTLMLVFATVFAFSQRNDFVTQFELSSQATTEVTKETGDTLMLFPGVTEDGVDWAQYWFSPDDGYLFGTNTYNDKAFGQVFHVDDQPYEVVGGTFWFGTVEGTDGYVIFRVWDMSTGVPGDVLTEEYVYLSDIWGELSLADAFNLLFTESVVVTDDFMVGFDVSNLNDYEHETGDPDTGDVLYGLGTVSSEMGQGGENFLVWVQESDDTWMNTSDYGDNGWDIDLGIFPYVLEAEAGEVYTVTFTIEDEEGDPIADATVELGSMTNDEGDYVFEDVPAGTHNYTVTADGFETKTGEVEVVDADVDVTVVMEEAELQLFTATFNVDMSPAIENGFDPENHSVYISGSFDGEWEWNEPGDNPDLELQPLVDTKESNDVVVFEETFDPAVDTGLLPEGWETKKADNPLGNNLEDTEGEDQRWIRYSQEFYPYDEFNESWIKEGEAAMHCNWDVEDVENAYAISPAFDIPEAESVLLEYWKIFAHDTDGGWLTEYNLLIEVDGQWTVLQEFDVNDGDNLYDEAVFVDLTGYEGTFRLAWVLKWTDGIQMTVDDISVTAYGVEGENGNGEEPEEMIYTVTVTDAVPEGLFEYKYFYGEGWDNGEFEGMENREVTVSDDMIFDDVWALHTVSVVENELAENSLNLFPNPVRNTLNVEYNDIINEIRVFDLTGRMVLSQNVNANAVSFNVSELNQGVYIMQVMTNTGVVSKKFNVTR